MSRFFRFLPFVFLFFLVAPHLAWILWANYFWDADPLYYGIKSFELYNYFFLDRSLWRELLFSGHMSHAPPLLTWVAQFFVPLAGVSGSVESGLLLTNFFFSCCSLCLIYWSVSDFFRSRFLALLAALAVSSAPLFFFLSTEFYVEPLFFFVVVFAYFVFSRSDVWPTRFLLLACLLVVVLGLLVKVTGLAYVLPLVAACVFVNFRSRFRRSSDVSLLWYLMVLLLLVVLGVGCLRWYGLNIERAFRHGRESAMHGWFGLQKGFLLEFWEWLVRLDNLLLPPYGLVLVSVVFLWVLLRLGRGRVFVLKPDLCGFVSLFMLFFGLSAHAYGVVDDTRFLLPMFPFLVFFMSWLLFRVGSRNLLIFFWLVFFVQWALTLAVYFNYVENQGFMRHKFFLASGPHLKNKYRASLLVEATCNSVDGLVEVRTVHYHPSYLYWVYTVEKQLSLNGKVCAFSYSPKCVADEVGALWFDKLSLRRNSFVIVPAPGPDFYLGGSEEHGRCSRRASEHPLVKRVLESGGFKRVDSPMEHFMIFSNSG